MVTIPDLGNFFGDMREILKLYALSILAILIKNRPTIFPNPVPEAFFDRHCCAYSL